MPGTTPDVHEAMIQLAVLEKVVEQQAKELERLARMVEAMAMKMDRMADTLTEARGGWKALMLLGGAGAAAGSAFTWFLTHWKGTP